ncbi:MAG: rod shape-determining protein [Proteobacteria bacterium]|nr:rod shape-determining protein [Pseudomonadota bacterium]MBU4297204.1 rod shape-determining protein [Pseudomonadota bacterium]MCG2748512.1 rod shape-determining protein [Desulfobulbaceae bacterium]
MTNRGYKDIIRSIVGYPKDVIGLKLVGKNQVFGDEALKHHSALTLYCPLEDGVIHEASKNDYNAAYELMKHVIGQARQGSTDDVCGVIGVPARASIINKELLLKISQDLMSVSIVVSEPFMVAYSLDKLNNSIIIDIGAGTVDICGMKGTIPSPKDQVTLLKAGDYVDERLESLIQQHYPDVQVTQNFLRLIKEQYGFVGEPDAPVKVSMRIGGKPVELDITEDLQLVCESIVPDIVEHLETIIRGFDPEDQQQALLNIYLAGGGSKIRGIDSFIAAQLHEYGDVRVTCVADSDYIGSSGALKMATEVPPELWDQVGFLS